MVAACLLSVIIPSGVALSHIRDLDIDRSAAEFEGTINVEAALLTSKFNRLLNDVRIISNLPPFQGIARSLHNRGIDPVDGSTLAMWKDRLQTIFASAMQQREFYTQVRLIGDADNGRELVRVDQSAEGLSVASEKQLQNKADEFYFQDTRHLEQGEIYLSPITLNREHGEVDFGTVPTIRAITPIFHESGQRLGVFVINVDIEAMLKDQLRTSALQYDTYIVGPEGVVAWFEKSSGQVHFRMDAENATLARYVQLASFGPERYTTLTAAENGHDIVAFVKRLELGSADNSLRLNLMQLTTMENANQAANRAQQNYLTSSLSAVLLVLLLVLVSARYITHPLKALRNGILEWGNDYSTLNLPTDRDDEVGEIARSFTSVVNEFVKARESEQKTFSRMSAAVDFSIEGLLTIDGKGQILGINKSACEILEIDTERAMRTDIRVLLPALFSFSEAKQGSHCELQLQSGALLAEWRGGDGRQKHVEMSVSEFESSEGCFYWIALRDISERLEQEAALKQALDELHQSNEELNDFAYIASHDLREPLRGIQIHAQTLGRKLPADVPEDVTRKVNRIGELAERMQHLVTDLLQLSRLNGIQANENTVDLNKILEEVRQNHAQLLEEKSARLVVQENLPSVRGDYSYLLSIFQNLIVNGIKYNESDYPEILVAYLGEYSHEGKQYQHVFSVADNGIGIDPEFHDSVFRIFKRLNNENAFGYGTGAGLTFVKKIVERYGGEIWLESKPGEGSEFLFTLEVVGSELQI
ncbi:MAG: ATP-binding protein [Pseudomonadales bacterium]|nr:ATP-binding protein [Pseudomonadales bacterium]